jgi:hypothetical protein
MKRLCVYLRTIIQLSTVITSQVATERNVPLCFSGELQNDYCDVPLPFEEKVRLGIFAVFVFIGNLC